MVFELSGVLPNCVVSRSGRAMERNEISQNGSPGKNSFIRCSKDAEMSEGEV